MLQFWLDQANFSRFRVDEDYEGPNGEPYVVLRHAPDDKAALPFRQIALGLYDRANGAVLCHDDWSGTEDDDDFLLVYYGDVVDFLITGELHDRRPSSLGWGFPEGGMVGYIGAMITDPDMLTLPMGSRRIINWLLNQVGEEPKVSLLELEDGTKSLAFSISDISVLSENDQEFLGWRIRWCLPRYYSVFITEGSKLARFPVLPANGTPLTAPREPVAADEKPLRSPQAQPGDPGHGQFWSPPAEELLQEDRDSQQLEAAIESMHNGDFAGAEKALQDIISRTPLYYVFSWEDDIASNYRFWTEKEFLYFTSRTDLPLTNKMTVWMPNAYGRAHYHLGYLYAEQRRYAEAIQVFDAGLRLEPTQVEFLLEKGYAQGVLGDHRAALKTYEEAWKMGEAISPAQRACAMRGQGCQYIEMAQLDAAQACYRTSMLLDPDDSLAEKELAYIASVRA